MFLRQTGDFETFYYFTHLFFFFKHSLQSWLALSFVTHAPSSVTYVCTEFVLKWEMYISCVLGNVYFRP